MNTIMDRQGESATSLALGKSNAARGHRVAELLATAEITAEQLLELNELVRQDWFDLCSEQTDYPRCGKVPDDLRRLHMGRIGAAEDAMEAWLGGGDAKEPLSRLVALC